MAQDKDNLVADLTNDLKKLKASGNDTIKALRQSLDRSGLSKIFDELDDSSEKFYRRQRNRMSSYRSMLEEIVKGTSDLEKGILAKSGKDSDKALYFKYFDTEGQKANRGRDLGQFIGGEYLDLEKALLDEHPRVNGKIDESLSKNITRDFFSKFGFDDFARGLISSVTDFNERINDINDNAKKADRELDENVQNIIASVSARDNLTQDEKEGIIGEARARANLVKNIRGEATDKLINLLKGNFIKELLESLFTDIGQNIADNLKKIYRQASKTIDDISKYSLSTSYIVDSRVREQALRYGLSDTQNYAFTQAKNLLGISSDEDLFWLNPNQRSMFSEVMEKESAIYDTMLSDGTLEGFQRLQIDFAVLKQEYMASVVKFISENKDTILDFATMGLQALQGLLNVVSGIFNAVNFLNPLSDKFWFNRLTGNNGGGSTTYNITMNNTANSSSKGDSEGIVNGISERVAMQLKNYFES